MTDDLYQFVTDAEYKEDIRQSIEDETDGDIESIFRENIKLATDVFFLLDKHNFSVSNITEYVNGLFQCTIQCDDAITTETMSHILDFYVKRQGVKVLQLKNKFIVLQIPELSYLYMALFEGTVVKWIHRLRKLIP